MLLIVGLIKYSSSCGKAVCIKSLVIVSPPVCIVDVGSNGWVWPGCWPVCVWSSDHWMVFFDDKRPCFGSCEMSCFSHSLYMFLLSDYAGGGMRMGAHNR